MDKELGVLDDAEVAVGVGDGGGVGRVVDSEAVELGFEHEVGVEDG
jgi:hypothetical protein